MLWIVLLILDGGEIIRLIWKGTLCEAAVICRCHIDHPIEMVDVALG